MIEIGDVASAVTGFVVAVAMSYYSIGLIRLMRRGKLEEGWRLVAAGSLIISVGLFLAVVLRTTAPAWVFVVGIVETLGGLFLLLGLRYQYRFWAHPKL